MQISSKKKSDLLGNFSPLPLKCGKAQSTVISPAKLSVGIVSSAEVIMHKSLLTLCSHGPIAVTIRVLGNIVRSPPKTPQIAGDGDLEKGRRRVRSGRSSRSRSWWVWIQTPPKKFCHVRNNSGLLSWDIFLCVEKESCERVVPLGKGYVCIPEWEPRTGHGLTYAFPRPL